MTASAPGPMPRTPLRRGADLPVAERANLRHEARAAEPVLPPVRPWHRSGRSRFALMLVVWGALVLLWRTPIALPVRVLTVVFHELGHALAAWATGGTVHAIVVSADGAGLTLTQGGSTLAILNGGYLGSLVGGMLLLRLLKAHGGGQLAAALLGCALVLVSLVFFALSPLGYAVVLLVGVLMLGLAARSPEGLADWVMRLVGWLCTFYAVIDLFDDIFMQSVAGVTDAQALERLTRVPAALWGASWALLGALFTWTNRRWLV